MTIVQLNGLFCVLSPAGRVLYRSFDEATAQAWLAARTGA